MKQKAPNKNFISTKDEIEINKIIKKYNKYVNDIVRSIMEIDEWYVRLKKEKMPRHWHKYIIDKSNSVEKT